jgi:hypothetical protein
MRGLGVYNLGVRNAYKLLMGKAQRKTSLGKLGVYGRIILKGI